MTQFEVDGTPMSGEVDEDGNFKFYIHISNCCGDELGEAAEKLVEQWWSDSDNSSRADGETPSFEEVSLTVHMTVKGIYQELFDWSTDSEGKIDSDAMPDFKALRNNCQWIIDQVDALKIRAA